MFRLTVNRRLRIPQADGGSPELVRLRGHFRERDGRLPELGSVRDQLLGAARLRVDGGYPELQPHCACHFGMGLSAPSSIT